jgi:hypothetical protein
MLSERLRELIDAGFSGLWIVTAEPDEAIAEIRQLATAEEYRIHGTDPTTGQLTTEPGPTFDPYRIFADLASAPDETTPDNQPIPVVVILPNFASYLTQDPALRQMAFRAIQSGKRRRQYLIILGPSATIPPELEKVFVVVDHELPDRAQLETIARAIGTEPGEMPEGDELARLIDASAGLTRYEAEGAYSLSIVRHQRIDPRAVWELKAQALKKGGALTLHQGAETFDDLGGMDSLKDRCRQWLRAENRIHAKGVMLLGPSGTGKSAFAKALGNEVGRPCITLDIGALMGSLVGQTEQATRHALKVIDAMAPALVFVDEVEKQLAGAGTDTTGVTTRIVGSFLTWLNDHESDIFVVATSNDITKLPTEFTRAERFDGIFFLDLPGPTQRATIWHLYAKLFALDEAQPLPDSEGWTGAEIRACCRLAAMQGDTLLDVAPDIIPVSSTASEKIEALRQWAAGRCRSADHTGAYTRTRAPATTTRRAVKRREE